MASAAAQQLLALARWRARIAARALVHQLFGTFQGRAALIVLTLALPSLWHLGAGGAEVVAAGLDDRSRLGALLVSHVALTLCFLVALPAYLLKDFVLNREEEPLMAHPWVIPELAFVRVLGAILSLSAYLWAFFYLFFFRLLTDGLARPWPSVAGHLLAGQLHFFVLGTLSAAGTRWAVLGTRMTERARLVQRLMIVPFLLAFPLFVLLPTVLLRHAPRLLAAIGEAAGHPLHLLQAPVGFAEAISGGSRGALMGWAALLFLSGGGAFSALWRWKESALRELPVDLNADRTPRFASAFSDGPGRRGGAPENLRKLRLFWIKDVLLPYRRDPLRYVREQGTVVIVLTVTLVLLVRGVREAPQAEPLVAAAMGTVLLAAVAWTALCRTLPSLGVEGEQIALLRPLTGAGALFCLKLLSGVAFTLVHALGYALVVHGAARAAGIGSSTLAPRLAEAVGGTFLLGLLGTGLGFLLPDLRRRSLFLPGASSTARLAFSMVAGVTLVGYGTGRALLASGVLDAAGFAGFLVVLLLPLFALAVALAAAALHRLQRVEL